MVKNLPTSAGDTGDVGSIHGLGRSPGRGNGNQLQYSCLENLVDRGGWRAAVHGVTKSWTRLNTHMSTIWTDLHGHSRMGGGVLPGSHVTAQEELFLTREMEP